MIDLSQGDWRKASFSNGANACVEVAANFPGVTAVRDSKRPDDGALVVSKEAFSRFLGDLKEGRFDL
ncbi:MAG: DUF397 domain-containing protein [Streptosporangiales bacterium]|nr:DUF397 domain-containing protein [Streptosporangiales bacterium]